LLPEVETVGRIGFALKSFPVQALALTDLE